VSANRSSVPNGPATPGRAIESTGPDRTMNKPVSGVPPLTVAGVSKV
jgi:hypothetical protein